MRRQYFTLRIPLLKEKIPVNLSLNPGKLILLFDDLDLAHTSKYNYFRAMKTYRTIFFRFFSILFILFVILAFKGNNTFSQTPSDLSKKLTIEGYLETYFTLDLNNGASNQRPDFFYSYHRTNEFNVNLGLVNLKYEENKIRSTLGLMAGTYANANMAHELPELRFIHEASIGYQLLDNHALWVDMGVLPSHIGFESSIGMNHWNLTRSILAENTPYYSAGVQLHYTTKNEKFSFAVMALNGWQRITRIPGNKTIALGHQFQFKPNDQWTLNSSSFIGNEFPQEERRMRYVHDFFFQYENDKFGLIGGIDVGAEQESYLSRNYTHFVAAIIESKVHLSKKMYIGWRGEYFLDRGGMLIDKFETPNWGGTFSFNYSPEENFLFRFEGRSLHNSTSIYESSTGLTSNAFYLSLGVALKMSE